MGDKVLIKTKRKNIPTPYHDPSPFTVIGINGSMITAIREGEIKSRKSSHFKRLPPDNEDDGINCPQKQLTMQKVHRMSSVQCYFQNIIPPG